MIEIGRWREICERRLINAAYLGRIGLNIEIIYVDLFVANITDACENLVPCFKRQVAGNAHVSDSQPVLIELTKRAASERDLSVCSANIDNPIAGRGGEIFV